MSPVLRALGVGDDAAGWRTLGFEVSSNSIAFGNTELALLGGSAGRGILGWTIEPVTPAIAGIAALQAPKVGARGGSGGVHPNGVSSIDHVVLTTPHLERTTEELTSSGIVERGRRAMNSDESAAIQCFFWLGDVILEVVGPPAPAGDGPAKLWGLALVADDLEAMAHMLGPHCGVVKPAVQSGRRIATLETRAVGISVPIAVMSPHKK